MFHITPWEAIIYLGLISIAALMRLWELDFRAMHHDESLHATYSWYLANGQGFIHNPMMHGPFQMEATAGVFLLFGDSDFTARLIYAVAGTILVILPIFLRFKLGTLGALSVSTLLTFSPSLLYFSRFARNDILMAGWTLGLVICMWRYLENGSHCGQENTKNARLCRVCGTKLTASNFYLYLASALLALSFATKETSYLVTSILALYLALVILKNNWASIQAKVIIGEVSPPGALIRLAYGLWKSITNTIAKPALSKEASFLILLATLTAPQCAAIVSILQDTPILGWAPNLVLASENPPIGAPSGGGLVIAALSILLIGSASVIIGTKWDKKTWLKCAVIFYVIWILLYSTFLTHPGGIGSGIWQGLGYWIVQQSEARGGQPWYYYIIITSVYEFLPLILSLIGGIYYMKRGGRFGLFLVYWTISTWILYTIASEKMPWLLVHISLPMILLSGKFLGEIITDKQWLRSRTALILVPFSLFMLLLTIQTTFRASYKNADIPVEMLVYTQTSPDIGRLNRVLQKVEHFDNIPIMIDATGGFTWPWAWYLRHSNLILWPSLENAPLQSDPEVSVLLVHDKNLSKTAPLLVDQYYPGKRIKHRWWFPETYKGVTVKNLAKDILNTRNWQMLSDYFFLRKLYTPMGSEDAHLFFSKNFEVDFSPNNK